MANMSSTKALKTFFERDDAISPGGGRKLSMSDLVGGYTKEEMEGDGYKAWQAARRDLAELAAVELGIALEA